MLQLHAERRLGSVQVDGGKQESAARLADKDPWITSIQLLHHFEQSSDLVNLEQEITVLEELVRSTSISDDQYQGVLENLGMALFLQFNHARDLEDAILTLGNAVNLTPHGHPNKHCHLNNLGNSFRAHFEHLGGLSDLEDAMSTRLNNLDITFITCFWCLGSLRDLEDTISMLWDAVDLTPHGHPEKPCHLNNLSSFFFTHFRHLGEPSDLSTQFRDTEMLVTSLLMVTLLNLPILTTASVFILSTSGS
ncbi:hypothetical protein HD554DRAFT_2169761 [Boletus coccyginus]|nr:hypothetical protein HD554DRAFT_2169761 [Boletus coccyginus]